MVGTAASALAILFAASAATAPARSSMREAASGDEVGKTADWAGAVVIQRDGRIVAVGSSSSADGSSSQFALARYRRNGRLDPRFGTGGLVLTRFGPTRRSFASSAAIQRDGKIVVAGWSSAADGQTSDFALARYRRNGHLDPSFGRSGRVLTGFRSGGVNNYAGALSVAIQPDGKIVAAGWSAGGFTLVRYLRNGRLDRSFGAAGRVLTDFGGIGWQACCVALQRDGRILAAGWESLGMGLYATALARYLPNGRLDPSFATGGELMGSGSEDMHGGPAAIAIEADGDIVVAGNTTGRLIGTSQIAVLRLRSDGSLDPSFGSGGQLLASFGSQFSGASAAALERDGKIIVAGFSASDHGSTLDETIALARFRRNGQLDPGFGSEGTVLTSFGAPSDAAANSVAIQRDGRIVAAGRSAGNFALVRYRPDGQIDSSFGADGKAVTDFAAGEQHAAR